MNRILTPFLAGLVGILGITSEVAMSAEPKDIVGPITRSELEAKHYAWLTDGMNAERAKLRTADAGSQERLKALAAKLKDVEIEAYIASWCPDTHEFLPIFLASLEVSGAQPKSVKFFALDKRKTYPGFKNELRIERIPTFVFLKDGKELGRFVEGPKKTVVEDVLSLLL
jgi:thiol-disulfide isomerase/thioredoxin